MLIYKKRKKRIQIRSIKNLNLINKKKQSKKQDNIDLLHSLFKSKNFYGASSKFFNKELLHYIYGKRHDHFIINLKYTVFYLKRIFKLIQKTIKKNKKILIIANSNDIKFLINKKIFNTKFKKKKNSNFIFFNKEWISGMFTNKLYPLKINKKNIGLVLVIKGSIEQKNLIKELNIFKAPIISFINTNEKLTNIKYPILTNKENIKSLYFLIYLIKKQIKLK